MSATMFAPDCTLTLATSQLLRTTPYLWAIFQAARSGCAQPRMLRHRLRLTQAPHDSASAAHPWEATRLGTTLDTWHTPTSFACESLHCTVPWQGDRWVLTAYTCRDLEAFPPSQLAHLRSLGFPRPGPPNNDPPALPKEDVADSADALFLDICRGASAPLSKELSSKGISCISVDLLGNESLDLLCDSTYDDLLRLAFSGVIRYAHASPLARSTLA